MNRNELGNSITTLLDRTNAAILSLSLRFLKKFLDKFSNNLNFVNRETNQQKRWAVFCHPPFIFVSENICCRNIFSFIRSAKSSEVESSFRDPITPVVSHRRVQTD